jgi:hypothetical protein
MTKLIARLRRRSLHNGKKISRKNGAGVEREEIGEVVSEARFDFAEVNRALEEFFERGCFAVGYAARDDEIEIAEIGRDVVGESVRGDPAADVDADGR